MKKIKIIYIKYRKFSPKKKNFNFSRKGLNQGKGIMTRTCQKKNVIYFTLLSIRIYLWNTAGKAFCSIKKNSFTKIHLKCRNTEMHLLYRVRQRKSCPLCVHASWSLEQDSCQQCKRNWKEKEESWLKASVGQFICFQFCIDIIFVNSALPLRYQTWRDESLGLVPSYAD